MVICCKGVRCLMYETSKVIKKMGISRQTLYNWINEGKISQPERVNNRRLVWGEENMIEIKSILDKANNSKKEDSLEFFNIGNRRYLGSKQKALDFIWDTVSKYTTGIETVADVFAGTGVVADFFLKKGKTIVVNDLLYSNYISYKTWFGNEKIDLEKLKQNIMYLNKIDGYKGYVTKNFGDRYFSYENAMKIDAIREVIENNDFNLNDREQSVLLTSLMYAMDKVANTVGHFDAYRKKMDSTMELELKFPNIENKRSNKIFNMDANELVRNIKADLVYIDTPYNSRGYENMYHVLENIIEWKKPKVEGVARKAIDRSAKGSEYTKSKAPIVFDDLITNINAKYILVSYNNTGENGNSRSNAKISHYEIVSTLLKRGKVKIFELDFTPFTTGKTDFDNHKELLYLCEVNNRINYINTPLNYSGSKYKLLSQILPMLPTDINRFFELFSGGSVITINHALYNKDKKIEYFINDIDKNVIDLYEQFSKDDYNILVKRIDKMIKKYGLSNTFKYGYSYYGCNSTDGLSEYNKEIYNKLKRDFNQSKGRKTITRSIQFYLLIVFGFNNQIRFNSNNEFNLPVGKRDFNNRMREKLFEFHSSLRSFNPYFSSKSYTKFSDLSSGDFVYIDPPYLLGNASYNENGGWTENDDEELFRYLDMLNNKGVRFAYSNVVLHKNQEHVKLMEWASKYNLHVLNFDYNNSNYQTTAKKSSTVEVLVTNY